MKRYYYPFFIGFALIVFILVPLTVMYNEAKAKPEQPSVVVYSGRDEKIIGPVFKAFEAQENIRVLPLYAGSTELLTRLNAEGGKTRCDLFLTNDVVTLERARSEGLLTAFDLELTNDIPMSFIARDNSWVGLTFRTRAIVYNKDLVDPEEIQSIFDLGDQKWKGKVATPTSANTSFISGIATMVNDYGVDKTTEFLTGLKQNSRGLVMPKHTPVVKAVANGEAALGYINHYYYYRHIAKDPDAPIGIIFPDKDNKGTPWNITGIGLTRRTANKSQATKLIKFLLSGEGQKLFAERNYEYPTNPNAATHELVPDQSTFKMSASRIEDMTDRYNQTIDIIQSLGLE